MEKQEILKLISEEGKEITIRTFFVTIFTWMLVAILIFIQYVIFIPPALILTLLFDRKNKKLMNLITKLFIKLFFILYITSDFTIDLGGIKKPEKPRIYIMNHASQFDTFLIYILPGFTKVFVKENYLKLPFIGWTIGLMGNIYVKKMKNINDIEENLIEAGKNELQKGFTLLIFPEGTKSKTGNIGRFKTGGFKIAYESKAEIVPVVLDTWNSIRPGGGGWIRDDKIWLKVLKPYQYEDYMKYEIKDFIKIVREQMTEELLNIRDQRRLKEKNYYRKKQIYVDLDNEEKLKLMSNKQKS
jgi:1-acyl-sn-glycerol-3-phosphate acyltransferase